MQFVVPLAVIGFALCVDLIFGDPPNKFHPTAWMGRLVRFLKPWLRSQNPTVEKIKGILFALFMVCVFSAPAYVLLRTLDNFSPVVYIVVAAIILKLTFAIRGMERASLRVAMAVEGDEIVTAREHLAKIVRRDTSKLDRRLILSATVESTAESTVDGIVSPFFYFALFGVPGAIAFRVINTLDSEVGYKDPEHVNIGWFSAKLDSILNFIPARLTAGLMVISASLLGEDYRNSWRILKRDNNKTESVNAGWPMSAMAGALRVELEKVGHYRLGNNDEEVCHGHVIRALRIMELTAFLFLTLIAAPVFLATVVVG